MGNTDTTKEFQARQRKVLKRMKAAYDDANEAAKLVLKGEDSEVDILMALFTDYGMESENEIFGEYYFNDIPAAQEDISYLTGIHTILEDEEIENENISALIVAFNLINSYLPFGNFAYDDQDNRVIFRLSQVVYSDQSEDELYRNLDTIIGHCMYATGQFAEPLVQIARGEMGIEEFIDLFEE